MEAICLTYVRQRVCYIQRRVKVANYKLIVHEIEAAGNQHILDAQNHVVQRVHDHELRQPLDADTECHTSGPDACRQHL